jgi:hypothetical protein
MNLPNPEVRSHYGNGFIKQYVRDHLILRTEAASNNVNDYGVNKAVENLPVLRKAIPSLFTMTLVEPRWRDRLARRRHFLLLSHTKQPFGLKSRRVRAERLGVTVQHGVTSHGSAERQKRPIIIDIVGDDEAAGPQARPSLVKLEHEVVFRMPAIVDEEIDLPKPREQLGEMLSARSFDVGPAVT